jgi:hypothetical protein
MGECGGLGQTVSDCRERVEVESNTGDVSAHQRSLTRQRGGGKDIPSDCRDCTSPQTPDTVVS